MWFIRELYIILLQMLPFIRANARVLTFCSSVGFFTALGQTFLIAQFIPSISEALELSRTQISTIYSLATLISSFGLAYLGKLLDKSSLLLFTLLTVIFLSFGTFLLGGSLGVISLWTGFFLLRLCGQITLGTIATTTVSRIYGRYRGKVLALTGFGRSLGEGIFPLLAVLVINFFGWRWGIASLGLFILIIMIPLSFFLVPRLPREALYTESEKVQNQGVSEWGWKYLFIEKRALIVMVVNAIIPFIFTGLFFQQLVISNYKGWDPILMSSAFIGYSLFKIVTSLGWGALIDRYSARVMQLFIFIPLIVALIILYYSKSDFGCVIYMSFLGAAMGLYALIRNSYWAERYGLKVLGEIKGMDSLFLVIGTSISPVFFSFILDHGITFPQLILCLVSLAIFGTITYLSLFFLERA